MNYCEFCGTYGALVFSDKECRKLQIKHGEIPVYHDFTVAIVKRSFMKGRKKLANIYEYYRMKNKIGYKLNYCPECGRKLKGAK